jgi:hypothetical protein
MPCCAAAAALAPHLGRVCRVPGGARRLREAGAVLVQPRVQDVGIQVPRDAPAASKSTCNQNMRPSATGLQLGVSIPLGIFI